MKKARKKAKKPKSGIAARIQRGIRASEKKMAAKKKPAHRVDPARSAASKRAWVTIRANKKAAEQAKAAA
jgi:hypothetical protein